MPPLKPTRKTTKAPAARQATGPQRTVRGASPATKPNPALLIGGIGGGVVVVALIAFVMMGGDKKPEKEATPKPAAAPEKKPVDVRELVNKGMKAGADGHAIITSTLAKTKSAEGLSEAQKKELKEKLQEGVRLIKQAGEYLEEASQKSGKVEGNYRSEWGEARKAANNFIANLGP